MNRDEHVASGHLLEPNRSLRRWWSAITVVLLVAVFAQAVFAGAMLSGVGWASDVHRRRRLPRHAPPHPPRAESRSDPARARGGGPASDRDRQIIRTRRQPHVGACSARRRLGGRRRPSRGRRPQVGAWRGYWSVPPLASGLSPTTTAWPPVLGRRAREARVKLESKDQLPVGTLVAKPAASVPNY